MTKSTRDITKPRKQRPTVTGEAVMVRVQPDMTKLLDDWRRNQADLPSRPEAIRRLVELGLKAKGK
jgi:predicted component of type VI protein secretion system